MPQTTATMALKIGNYIYLPSAGLEVLCRVEDVKNAYGNLRYQIRPVEGRGSAWVNATSVLLANDVSANRVSRLIAAHAARPLTEEEKREAEGNLRACASRQKRELLEDSWGVK